VLKPLQGGLRDGAIRNDGMEMCDWRSLGL
jgi:hypothetical protein